MSQITTHVLDQTLGKPASGVAVGLEEHDGTKWLPLAVAATDADGRIGDLGPDELAPGRYRLTFDTAGYFAGQATFYPEVTIVVSITDAAHYHVPLLLSPFAYSTYRGS